MTTQFAKPIAAALSLSLLFACGGTREVVAPAITAQPQNATVAAGGNATFAVTASGDSLQYQWSLAGAPISGATGASYTTSAAALADDRGVYTVTVSNGAGKVTSAAAILRVVGVALTAQPADLALAQGGSAAFTLTATGTGTLSYQWSRDGVALAGWNAPVYRLETALSSDSGAYACVVSSTLNGVTATAASRVAVLNVVAPPALTAQPKALTLLAGTSATFSVVVAAGDALGYQWQKDGIDVAGATAASYTIASVSAAHAGSYACVVTNTKAGFGVKATSSAAQLVVATKPALTDSGNLLAGEGAPASLAVVATVLPGMSSPTYQWSKNGASIAGATASVFAIGAVAAADAGTYSCVVTSSVGGVSAPATSNPMVVTVVPRPTVVAQPAGLTLPPGDKATFTVSANGADTIGYQWKKDGVAIAGATSGTLVIDAVSVLDAASYVCTISNTRSGVSAFTDSAPALLTITAGPQITAQTGDLTVLETQPATLSVTAAGSGLTYQWYRGAAAIDGATSSSYATGPTAVSDSGAVFHCVVSNGHPPDTASAPATLTVLPTPVALAATTTTLSKGEGAILTFNFPVSASGTITGGFVPVAVTRGGSLAVYPTANTTYSLKLTQGGVTTTGAQVAISVKTYQPKNVFVVVRHDNAPVYDDSRPGKLKRFTISATDGTVAKSVSDSLPTGRGPGFVLATPDEKHLYVLNNALETRSSTGTLLWAAESSVSPFSVASNGVLTSAGPAVPLSTCAEPWSAVTDLAGQRLYVGCDNGIEVFSIDSGTGLLTHAPALDVSIPGRRQGDLLVHPSGKWVYVIDNLHSLLKTYALDASGKLTFVTEVTVVSRPDSLTFDRAGTLLFTRGTLPQLPSGKNDPNNAAIYVFGVDPYTGALALKSSYFGFDNRDPQTYWAGHQPFVRGLGGAQLDYQFNQTNTPDSHHTLSFSKKPGVDQLINAYDTDMIALDAFSQYTIDVPSGTVQGDFVNPDWLASPVYVTSGLLGDAGQSMVFDRSGSIIILPVLNNTYFIAYYTDDVGGLRPATSFSGELQYPTGATPIHAVFTGTLQ
jgi:hypothetical protein